MLRLSVYIKKKLKYLAKYELRKQLAETSILSNLDYADLVFYPHHNSYFPVGNGFNSLHQVLYSVTMLRTFRMYVLKVGWLPIINERDLNLLKSCFKALHNPETYLKKIKQEYPKELRSSNSIRLVVPTENGTFQDNASKLFNNLPETIRNCKDYKTF